MKVEWTENIHGIHEGVITLGDKKYETIIYDHTSKNMIEADQHSARKNLRFAYTVYVPEYIPYKYYFELGFEGSYYQDVGIDISENLINDNNYDCRYVGNPKHTIEDVKKLVVQGFINAFQFDYDKALKEAIDEVNERKARMDEVNEYKFEE